LGETFRHPFERSPVLVSIAFDKHLHDRDGAVLVGAGQRLCLPLWGVPVGHNVTLVQVGLTANKCHFRFVP
jgi:hypothetical protein